MAGLDEPAIRVSNGADLADELLRLGTNARLIVSYRSGPNIGVRPAQGIVEARLWSIGEPGYPWDPGVDPLRSRLLADGWAPVPEAEELMRRWSAGGDPGVMFNDLRQVYVTTYSATPRWLKAWVLEDPPWTDAVPYLVLYVVPGIVAPAVIGAIVASAVAGWVGAGAAGPPYGWIGAVTAAVFLNTALIGGDWLAERLGVARPAWWAFILVPLVGTIAITLLIALLYRG